MTRVLAIDGGQSAIRVGHSDTAGTIELSGVSRLEGDTVAAVAATVIEGWRLIGTPSTDRAVLGLTTAPTDEPSRERLCRTVASGVMAREIWLADDAITSHAGALSGGWGVSITVGTGVACLAAPRDGRAVLVGGHGYLIGDEGGAFWIGSAGIRAVLKSIDGRGPSTALEEPAAEHFRGLADLGDRLHSGPRPVDSIARFAPSVLAVAATGDEVAAAIVDAAADELDALARAAVQRVDDTGGPVPLALGGRLIASGALRTRLEQRLAASAPDVQVRSADAAPLHGALLLGGAGLGRYRDHVYAWSPDA